MSPRTFTFIAAATILAVGLAAFSLARQQSYRPVAGVGEKMFPDLLEHVNDAARLIVDGPQGTITLSRGDGGWTMKESEGYAGRTVKVQRVILGLAQLRMVEAKTRMKEKYSKLGLQDRDAQGAKSKRVKLFDDKGALLADLLTGEARKTRSGNAAGGVYVRRPGDAQAWLASDNAGDFDSEKSDWLERKIINIKPAQVKRLVIRHPGGETVVLSKATPETPGFTLENIPQGKKLMSPASLETVGGALADLQLDDVRNGPIPFDGTKTVTTDVTTFQGLSVRVLTTERDGKFWITLDATGTDKAEKIMARTGGWVYRISNYVASNLTKKPDELLEDDKPKS